MREIKFRAWDKLTKKIFFPDYIGLNDKYCIQDTCRDINDFILMQYTGLKDKNGKEIYELHEINNKYIVIYLLTKYVLFDISNNNILDLGDFYYENECEITKEYQPLSEDQKRHIDKYLFTSKGKNES